MAINRYTQQQNAQYNPLSMQELAFAPQFLRQRHDETMAANQMLQEQLGAYNVHPDFNDPASRLIDPIQQNITSLSEDLANKGINESGAVNRLMKLSGQQKELFSPRGGIGQLQARTQQFQEAQKQLQDFFKDTPQIAQYKLRQANIGDAKINPDTGKLELGDMSIPNYVRHIPDEEIMETLNTAVKGLKPSDLASYGIQSTGSLGEFNDLFNVDMVKGVTPDRIADLLGSLVGPEIQQSITQYGETMGYTPEESLGMFQNRLVDMANASAYTDRDRRYFNVLDQRGVQKLKEDVPSIPFIVPGGSFESPLSKIFGDVKIDKDDSPYLGKSIDPKYWEERGYNVINNQDGFVVYDTSSPFGRNVPIYSHSNEETAKYNKDTQRFLEYKNAIPELRNLSNKEAKERIDKYSENLQTQYSNTINPGNKRILEQLNEAVLGSGGDVSNRRVLGQQGGSGDFLEVLDNLGYSDYEEFEKSGPQIHGYRMIPGQGIFYEAKVKDKNNDNVPSSIFIQADPVIENSFEKSSAISNAIVSGVITDTAFEENGWDRESGEPIKRYTTVINNPGTNKEPIVIESSELLNQEDVLGLSAKQIIDKYGEDNIQIRSIKDIIQEEADLVNENLRKQF